MGMEHHRYLRILLRGLLLIPFAKQFMRTIVRKAIIRFPLSQKNRQRLFNFFAQDTLPATPVNFRVHVPIKNGSSASVHLKLVLHDMLAQSWYFGGYNLYEPAVVRLLRRLLNERKYFFDIGANIGYYTFLAAALLEGRGQVHSFEPWDTLYKQLEYNATQNNFSCLHLNQQAVSDRNGVANLFLPSEGHWTNASLIEGFWDQIGTQQVDVVRFDTYCDKHMIEKVDLVKIDVEGGELGVLKGMGTYLEKNQPDLILEVLKGYCEDLDTFLADIPYRKYLITDSGLEETESLEAHPRFRDYYLSCFPVE